MINSNITTAAREQSTKKAMKQPFVRVRLEDLQDGTYYRVNVLQAVLRTLGLNYSIFSIRDAETWKCLNYDCGKRWNEPVEKCANCGGDIKPPSIKSPRSRGGGKGVGHRRYTKEDIKHIIDVFT